MVNRIPEDKIAEIRNSADIVEIVSDAVQLKKAGRNYLGLCPFHNEKTPSFSVSPDKQIFHCFGCGVGGDIFTFLMKQEGFSFLEAAKKLAGRYGIEIPQPNLSPEQHRQIKLREELLNINQEAMQYFCNVLKNSRPGKIAGRYLLNRGLTEEVIDQFSLGFAPDGWDNLLKYFNKKGIRATLVEKCGLVIPNKSRNGYYDRFRNRVIFPIFGQSQQVIGFGGRVMDDGLPKYLNSPETPVYHKSRSLYGLNRARNQCRREETVYIVEGYFDLIALHQNGITNSVATLGTALTPEHVKILRGFIGQNGKAVLVYDSDEAGIRAAQRSIAVFDNAFVNAQILVLQEGHDPDSFIQAHGIEKFHEAAANATSGIEFLLESAIQQFGMSIDGKLRVISELMPPLAAMNDNIAIALHTKQVAERLDITEEAIAEKLIQYRKRSKSSGRGAGEAIAKKLKPRRSDTGMIRIERRLIAMMLQFPEIHKEIEAQNILDYFENTDLQAIGKCILQCRQTFSGNMEDQSWVAMVVDEVEESLKGQVTHLANTDDSWNHDGSRRLIAQFLRSRQKIQPSQSLEAQIKAAEKNNDEQLLEKLLIEKHKMAVQRSKQNAAMHEDN